MGLMIERCPTGIRGFDVLCQGGFVKNSSNVLLGGPGSGKTIFLLQYLYNGATMYNENGLYVSFEPDIVETLNDAMVFGWDLSKMNEAGKITFVRLSPETDMAELKGELTKIVAKNNIKRICFDPISIVALNIENEAKIREVIFDLASLMKRLKVTCVFADESMEGVVGECAPGQWSRTDIMKFLVDGVVTFHDSGLSGVGDRAIRIVKMRRTKHSRGPVGMQIGDRGIEVLPNQ